MTSQHEAPRQGAQADSGLRGLVRESPLAVWLFELDSLRVVEASEPLVRLLGGTVEQLRQHRVTDFVIDSVPLRSRLALLATGELDSYRLLERRTRRLDGREFALDLCVAAVGEATPRRHGLGVHLPMQRDSATQHLPRTLAGPAVLVLGAVDAGWRIDRISADATPLLGYDAGDVIGVALSEFIHVEDLPLLLIALGQGHQQVGGGVVRLRVRTVNGAWQLCQVIATPLVGQTPLGFAFALTPVGTADEGPQRGQLESHLRRIAWEVTAAGVHTGPQAGPAGAPLPVMAELTAREVEIVTRLHAGERVPLIARRMFVSESTVRNHLTSVYRKFAVSSQQELLSALRPPAKPAAPT